MKFGQYLKTQRNEEWIAHYIDYKGLKDIIKELAASEKSAIDVDIGRSGFGERVTSLSSTKANAVIGTSMPKEVTETMFFAKLEKEMEKVDAFTHSRMLDVQLRTEAIEAKLNFGGKIPSFTEQERDTMNDEARSLGDDFLKIEKFVNLNFLGFHKILKKHDKQLPSTPCRKFYLTRLHGQRWVKHDYSKLFVNLSKIHAVIRGDKSGIDDNTGAQNFVRTTTKYWVRTEDISRVKHILLQHLPIFQHDLDALEGDSQATSSVYFDNTQLELYHGRLDKTPGAIAIRFRWYATNEPDVVFVERKTHHDSWTGDLSVKERFTLKEKQVLPFLRGEYTVEDKIAEMQKSGKSQRDQDNVRRLFSEIYSQIDSKQLRPTMRTVYMRAAYQIPFDATVRVSLDTNLTMIAENPKIGPDCATEGRWYRNPEIPLPPTEFTLFPHAVLEVKLSLKEGDEAPKWVADLITSNLVTQVHKFSKFIHGCATLLSEDVQAVPYWVDDESIQPSMLRSQPPVRARRSFIGTPESVNRETKKPKHVYPFGYGPHESIQLMERKPSIVSNTNYGTVPGGFKDRSMFGTVYESYEESGFLLWVCSPIRKCFFGSPAYESIVSKPRKTPMKVEPKVFFANERTLLSWLHMAITLGSISAALLGMSGASASSSGSKVSVSKGEEGARLIGLLLLPVAIVFCGYALNTFYWRGQRIRSRTEGPFHDEVGPFVLGGILMLALSAIFFISQKALPLRFN